MSFSRHFRSDACCLMCRRDYCRCDATPFELLLLRLMPFGERVRGLLVGFACGDLISSSSVDNE